MGSLVLEVAWTRLALEQAYTVQSREADAARARAKEHLQRALAIQPDPALAKRALARPGG